MHHKGLLPLTFESPEQGFVGKLPKCESGKILPLFPG